jgi:hypothetical protein
MVLRRVAGGSLLTVAFALLAVACGAQSAATPPPPPQKVDDSAHGLAYELPPGWQRATVSLTPHLVDPREVLSAGTFQLRYRETECAHVAGSALEDMGPTDAFITLQERGLDPGSDWAGFPPRPAHFGPTLGGSSEASACVPSAQFTDHWFTFSDAGRHFHVLVAFGPKAPDAVQREAWGLLDSLRVDPAVRPDWKSCC